MAQLRVTRVGNGLHPSEVIVSVETADGGREEVMLDQVTLSERSTIEIGNPISKDAGRSLVELPRETARGSWRVWVPNEALDEIAA